MNLNYTSRFGGDDLEKANENAGEMFHTMSNPNLHPEVHNFAQSIKLNTKIREIPSTMKIMGKRKRTIDQNAKPLNLNNNFLDKRKSTNDKSGISHSNFLRNNAEKNVMNMADKKRQMINSKIMEKMYNSSLGNAMISPSRASRHQYGQQHIDIYD
jgi:hypothetical protein